MADWLCGFSLIAQMFCSVTATSLSGYIEGEALFVAPIEAGRIASLSVRRGDELKAGDTVAALESDDARFALDAATARHAEAKARLVNLTTGKRAEEIAVIEANRAAARADLAQADLDLHRIRDLVKRKVQSQSALDQARTARNVASARLQEMEANLQVAGIAARVQEIEAARRVVDGAAAAVQDAEWRLAQRTLKAPSDGRVEEIIRYAGETAGPAAPVVSLLPPDHRTLKIFVPQARVSAVRLGQILPLQCDGCPDSLQARVSFIASGPEFTPPVIYSVESRQKLVVLVRAELLGEATRLSPGQIVDVPLAAIGGT
jgi:HlyD family secretion protein